MNHMTLAAIIAHNGTDAWLQLIASLKHAVAHTLHGTGYGAHCWVTYPKHMAGRLICNIHEIKRTVHPG